MDHEISEDELRDLLAWVGEVQIEHKAKDAMKNATAEDELGEEMDAVYSAIGSTSASSGGNGVKGSEDNAGVGYGAGKAKGKAHGLGQGRDSDYSELISAAGGKEKEGGKDRDSRPYTLEEQGEYSGSWVISFPGKTYKLCVTSVTRLVSISIAGLLLIYLIPISLTSPSSILLHSK